MKEANIDINNGNVLLDGGVTLSYNMQADVLLGMGVVILKDTLLDNGARWIRTGQYKLFDQTVDLILHFSTNHELSSIVFSIWGINIGRSPIEGKKIQDQILFKQFGNPQVQTEHANGYNFSWGRIGSALNHWFNDDPHIFIKWDN